MRELIRDDQKKKAKQKLDSLLLEGLEGTTSPMTKADWAELHQELKLATARKRQTLTKRK